MEYIKAIKDEIEKVNSVKFLNMENSIMNNEIKLISLTQDNVINIETMLKYNPRYSQSDYIDHSDEEIFKDVKKNYLDEIKNKNLEDINLKDIEGNNEHSSKYYIKAFKHKYFDTKSLKAKDNNIAEDKDYIKLLYIILRKINNENSTRVSIPAIIEITKEVSKNSPSKLIESLKEPYKKDVNECDYKLIKDICIKANQKNGDDNSGRYNFSLATKFCHYMNFNIFNGTNYQDLFSIYDTVVKNNLEYYYYQEFRKKIPNERSYLYSSSDLKKLEECEAQDFLVKKYKNFQLIIDDILKKKNYIISRNGFDHLIWYTNKGSK